MAASQTVLAEVWEDESHKCLLKGEKNHHK